MTTTATRTAAQLADLYSRGANAIQDGLLRAGLLLGDADPRLVHGELLCAIARHALGPNWADLCAQRALRVLAGKGWLRSEEAPRARAIARHALEGCLRLEPAPD